MDGGGAGTAIVTGASRGIGRACADEFGALGWRVINISRTPLAGVINIRADLTKPEAATLEPQLSAQLSAGGRICLVHNAASADSGSLWETTPQAFRRMLELNVTAPFVLSRICRPYMQRGSSILYVGSTLSEKAVPKMAAYVTSKHAIAGLMRATCQDLPAGLHTACVCPGFVDTEMLRELVAEKPARREEILSMVAEHRMIEPREIAKVVVFCAQNPVVNGAVLHANLGQLER